MQIPLIDFNAYDETNAQVMQALGNEVSNALTKIGFMAVTNIGISAAELQQVFATSQQFFALSDTEKLQCAYTNAADNFGFQGMLAESLDPALPADLKETFTMRDPQKYAQTDSRWPTVTFRETSIQFYQDALAAANKVLRVFAAALGVKSDYFVQTFSGENVTLRFLHYPSVGPDAAAQQLGAGAHTDYGIITLLFQDAVGGLEVKDADGIWQPVGYVENAIIINTGDLMERWTNGRYKSTLHRVQPKIGQQARYSIALFMDPDSKTEVSVLDHCVSETNPAKYPPITAGEHIQQKLEATHQY